jgi:hypothetical protein
MPCVSSRDQTTCWRLFHPLQGAVPRALSDLHRNPKKQTPEHLPSPFSPIDGMQANASAQTDTSTLGISSQTSLAGHRLKEARAKHGRPKPTPPQELTHARILH